MIVRKERCDLENAVVEFYLESKNHNSAPAFEEVFDEWIQDMKQNRTHAVSTANRYQNDYDRYLKNCEFVKYPMTDFTEHTIVKALKTIMESYDDMTVKRFASIKTIFRGVFVYARLDMDIDCISIRNVMDDLRFPIGAFKVTEKLDNSQVFKKSEIRIIKQHLTGTDSLRELGILLTIETGLRVGELVALRRDDVQQYTLKIRRSEHKAQIDGKNTYFLGTPKENKIRTVELSEVARNIIDTILDISESEWLFPNPEDNMDWMRSYYFDRTIRKVCKELRIPQRSMHKFRKSYSSILLAQGLPEKLVQTQLGHSDILTTQRSYHYDIFDEDEKEHIFRDIRIG